MADIISVNVQTGERTERNHTQAEKDAMKLTTDEKWSSIRNQRDRLLRDCDWWGYSDVTMSDEQTAYRQALRDLPASESNPDNIIFPSKP